MSSQIQPHGLSKRPARQGLTQYMCAAHLDFVSLPHAHIIFGASKARQADLHSPVQISQNYPQHSDNMLNFKDCGGGR